MHRSRFQRLRCGSKKTCLFIRVLRAAFRTLRLSLIVCSPFAAVNERSNLSALPSMMLLHDEVRRYSDNVQHDRVMHSMIAEAYSGSPSPSALALGLAPAPLVHRTTCRTSPATASSTATSPKIWLQHGVYGLSSQTTTGSIMIRPTLIRLPGYPLFSLSASASSAWSTTPPSCTSRLAIDLLTCCLAAALAGRLFGQPRRPGCPLARSPLPLHRQLRSHAPHRNPQPHLIALAFYASFAGSSDGASFNRWLWLISVALGYSILLRPEQGLLAAAIVPAMLWIALRQDPKPARQASPVRHPSPRRLPSASSSRFVPWTIRNWHTFHVFQPLAPRYATDPGETIPRLPPLVPHLGHRLRLHRKHLLELRRRPHRTPRHPHPCLRLRCLAHSGIPRNRKPSTRTTSSSTTTRTQRRHATLDARLDAIAQRAHPRQPLLLLCCCCPSPVSSTWPSAPAPRCSASPPNGGSGRQHPEQILFRRSLRRSSTSFTLHWPRRPSPLAHSNPSGWRERAPLAWAMIAFIRCAAPCSSPSTTPSPATPWNSIPVLHGLVRRRNLRPTEQKTNQ